jgi:hypothetical protein
MPGLECFPCPAGADCQVLSAITQPLADQVTFSVRSCASDIEVCCQGKLALPSPSERFWAKSVNSSLKQLVVYDPPGSMPDPSRRYFFDCGSSSCLANFECAPGYTGLLCKACKPNQFFWGGKCDTPCTDIAPAGPITILAMLAVVLVWTVLQTLKSDVLLLLLAYMQIMAVGFSFQTEFGHNSIWETIAFIFRAGPYAALGRILTRVWS